MALPATDQRPADPRAAARPGPGTGPGTGPAPGDDALRSGDGGRIGDLEVLVTEARSFLARFDPGRHAVDDVRRAMGLFSTLGNLATAGLALGAPRLAETAGPSSGRRSVAEDVATITGSSLSEAHRLLAVGEVSRTSSGVEGALRGGDLSRERAALVSEGLAVAPGAEDELLTAAASESFRRLRDRQRHAKARARRAEDDRARAARLVAGRRMRTFVDDDGFFRLEGHLTPEAGALLASHLEAETDQLLARNRRAGQPVGPDATRADALCALIDRGAVSGGAGSPPSSAASGPATSPPPLPGPRAAVTLRVDLAALRRGELEGDEICEIPGVGPVPLAVARALLGDAVVDLVVAKGVDVTTTAHVGRTVPTALRRALAERDGGCVIPGCGASWTLEVDHWRLPFAEGGEASLDNLVTLCRFHHHLRHYQGYLLTGGPGRWRFEPPLCEPSGSEDGPPRRHDEDAASGSGGQAPP